jgi:serine protease AprX
MNTPSVHRIRAAAPRAFAPVLCAVLLLTGVAAPSSAATLGPSLAAALNGVANSVSVGPVIVSFKTSGGLTSGNLTTLLLTGITHGYKLQQLGMVAVPATAGQVRLLANNASVRSIWLNDSLSYLNDQTRVLTGVDRMRSDPDFTALHQGLPVTGQGIGVLINDSGIDATHPDLPMPGHVVQNVLGLLDVTSLLSLLGFINPLYLENLPITDLTSGHGTHCAGIVGGTGAASNGRYAGVAPGARLIGFGSGVAITVLNALGGFEYALENQSRYNIRVISNSWGGQGAFDPNDPIVAAAKTAHDRGIVVVFAAGNSGPGKDTMSPEARAPWVISVAAGTKEGGLASFSSRGVPKAQRPAGDANAPTLTAPGTGREFAADSGRFTAGIVSTRAKTNLIQNGLISGDDLELAPLDLLSYTEISGTSMAAPFVAGTVALMLSADPTLTPDGVKAILTQTATQMPGTSEFEAGAGYINVYAAVDKVYHRAKAYGTYGGPADLQSYNLAITTGTAAQTPFHIDYDPAASIGPGSANALAFTVAPGISVLDVSATVDDVFGLGEGNTVGLLLTDPNGGTWSSGVLLPVLDTPNREVVVKNPVAGPWLLEVRGIRGLAALPEVALPLSGLALPGPVDGSITQQVLLLPPVPDIAGDPARAEIEFVLKNRMLDVLSDGLFHPASAATRGDFARALVYNTALRQSLAAAAQYTDVTGPQEAIAEAVTANGSTLRDGDFTPTGLMTAAAPAFAAASPVTRLDVAVALVKALGLDAAAQAKAGTDVTATANGNTVIVSDQAAIPAGLRGYVQIALDRGILNATFTASPPAAAVQPAGAMTRSSLAFALDHYRQAFAAGNSGIQVDGSSLSLPFSLDGLVGELDLTFESVTSLSLLNLGVSVLPVSPSDPGLLARLPQGVSILSGFPLLARIEPPAAGGLSFTGVAGVQLTALSLGAPSPLAPLTRLYAAPLGGPFRDITSQIKTGTETRVIGAREGFSEFLLVTDPNPLAGAIAGKLDRLDQILSDNTAAIPPAVFTDLAAELAATRSHVAQGDPAAAIQDLGAFLTTVQQHSGTGGIPDVWRAQHDLTNVAGLLRAAGMTLQFSLLQQVPGP